MLKKTVTDKLLEDNIKANKLTLIKSFENNFKIQESTLELFVNGIKHSDSNRFYDTKLIWNLAGFISTKKILVQKSLSLLSIGIANLAIDHI